MLGGKTMNSQIYSSHSTLLWLPDTNNKNLKKDTSLQSHVLSHLYPVRSTCLTHSLETVKTMHFLSCLWGFTNLVRKHFLKYTTSHPSTNQFQPCLASEIRRILACLEKQNKTKIAENKQTKKNISSKVATCLWLLKTMSLLHETNLFSTRA